MSDSTPTAESLLEGAEGFFDAFTVVSKKYGQATDPMGLLAAHCLEITLKAYLLKVGRSEKDLKNIGHDLVALWHLVPSDLGLDPTPPYWVQVLNFSHSSPYYFRYATAKFGVAIPHVEELTRELNHVLQLARAKVPS